MDTKIQKREPACIVVITHATTTLIKKSIEQTETMFGTNAFTILALLCLVEVQHVNADQITSKEYKAMMKPANFTGSSTTVNTRLASLKTALAAYATSKGRTSSGSFSLKSGMPREVKFYDTRYCDIYNNGYAYRMRRDKGKTNWEGTLKFRNADQAVADDRRTKMNQCATTDLGGKFEGDISLGSSSFVYAYSHDCSISDGKNINILDDVEDTWNEINQVWVNEFGFDMNEDIDLVYEVMSEKAYSGFKVNFPGTVAEFTVSLWYRKTSSTVPVLAELSFTTSAAADASVDSFWSGFGTATQLTPWLDANALFKTNWMYTQWGC